MAELSLTAALTAKKKCSFGVLLRIQRWRDSDEWCQSLSVTSLGFRTILSTAKCYRFGATLTTAVSGANSTAKRLRSSLGPFDWKSDCFLCGKDTVVDSRHPDRESVSEVTLLGFRTAILKQCSKRDDYWAHGHDKTERLYRSSGRGGTISQKMLYRLLFHK